MQLSSAAAAAAPDTSAAASSALEVPPAAATVAPPAAAATASKSSETRLMQLWGMLYVFLSTFLFSASSLCVAVLARGAVSGDGAPVLLTVITRFGLQAALSLLGILVLRHDRLSRATTWLGQPQNRWKIVARGGWGVAGLTCWFATLSAMPMSDATAITYINVPLSALFARLILKEPYTRVDAAVAALAMVGVVLVAQPAALFGVDSGGGGGGDGGDGGGGGTGAPAIKPIAPLAVAVALLGACCSAMAYVSARRVGPGEDTLVIVLLFAILGVLISPVLAALAGTFAAPIVLSPRAAGLMVAAGALGWAGQLLLNAGLQRAPSGPASVMRFNDLIFALLLQSTLLDDPPNALKLVGSALVMSTVGGTAYRSWLRSREEKLQTQRARASELAEKEAARSGGAAAVAGAAAEAGAAAAAAAGGRGEDVIAGSAALMGDDDPAAASAVAAAWAPLTDAAAEPQQLAPMTPPPQHGRGLGGAAVERAGLPQV